MLLCYKARCHRVLSAGAWEIPLGLPARLPWAQGGWVAGTSPQLGLYDTVRCKMASASDAANLLCLVEKRFCKRFDKLSCRSWIKLLIYQHPLHADPRKRSGSYLEYYKPSAICMLSRLHFNPITFQQIALDKRSHGQGICNAYKLTRSFNTRES